MRYLTIVYRKDRRITIGSRIHQDAECKSVKDPATLRPVTGEILKMIPQCKRCFKK